MGNRAVITTPAKRVGIYLHWNGGRDSVEAFLAYCKLRGFCSPDRDASGWANLANVICTFLGTGMDCGIDTIDSLDCDNGDNGVYIIKDWEIVGREFFNGKEQRDHDLHGMLKAINRTFLEKRRVDEEVLDNYVRKIKGTK